VWSADEYDKLPGFDLETWEQPPSVFMCHQQDGCLCAGWVAVHDMPNNMGLRLALATGMIDPEQAELVEAYTTDVQLHPTGEAAAEYGKSGVDLPGPAAIRTVQKLSRKLGK
jgi:hypothetical protein